MSNVTCALNAATISEHSMNFLDALHCGTTSSGLGDSPFVSLPLQWRIPFLNIFGALSSLVHFHRKGGPLGDLLSDTAQGNRLIHRNGTINGIITLIAPMSCCQWCNRRQSFRWFTFHTLLFSISSLFLFAKNMKTINYPADRLPPTSTSFSYLF